MLHKQSKIALIIVLMIIINTNGISADLEGRLSRSLKDFTRAQQKFQNEILNTHNNHRSHHCARAFHLDHHLTRSAQNYAKTNRMVHSGIKGIGENHYIIQ